MFFKTIKCVFQRFLKLIEDLLKEVRVFCSHMTRDKKMSNHIIISEQRFCYFNSYVIDFIKEILCSNSEIKCSLNLIKKKIYSHIIFSFQIGFFSRSLTESLASLVLLLG